MRVRPFVWLMLAAVCAGVLIFATSISLNKTVPLLAHIEQISTTRGSSALLRLRLTDSEGIPVDQARVTPQASMPNMRMNPQLATVQSLGQGLYLARISFSMTGPWKIDLIAYADGFNPLKQSIIVNIV
ncbi:MAG TPA: FixH family protein [Ktedonobacteraceae bacterium]